jgi:hypothetical protein
MKTLLYLCTQKSEIVLRTTLNEYNYEKVFLHRYRDNYPFNGC